MSSSPIRVGFVGLSISGWAATSLAPSLFQPSLKDKFTLVALSTTSESSAKAAAEKYAPQAGRTLKPYHGSSSAIANDPDVDLVAVSVRSYLHKEVILPVIEAKKSYFLEWPAGKNTTETEEIAAASKAQGVRGIIGLQGRGSHAFRKVKEILASGVIGRVVSTTLIATAPREICIWGPEIKQEYVYANKKTDGASMLTIVGGHLLDPLTQALGQFESLSAVAKIQHPNITVINNDGTPTGESLVAELPDHYAVNGQLETGVFVTVVLRAAYKAAPGPRGFLWDIDGEAGSIRLESDFGFANVRNPAVYLNKERVEVAGSDSETIGILTHAWEQIALGDEGNYATIDDAVNLHRVLDTIERSAEEGGRTINLK